jgi:hypothetical protein
MQDDAELVQISRSDDVEGFFSGVSSRAAVSRSPVAVGRPPSGSSRAFRNLEHLWLSK